MKGKIVSHMKRSPSDYRHARKRARRWASERQWVRQHLGGKPTDRFPVVILAEGKFPVLTGSRRDRNGVAMNSCGWASPNPLVAFVGIQWLYENSPFRQKA